MKPVVFLSHASQDNPRALALQRALKADAGVDTAFDVQNLEAGDAYRPQLYRWMARCQGAVLLLTEPAMASHWVLQEATVLRARSMNEGRAFRLFMLVDAAAMQHPAWATLFAPLALTELQYLKLAAPGDSTDAFIASVRQGMQAVAGFGEDHRGRLAELIYDRLAPFMAQKAALRALAEWLQADDALWHGIVPAEHALQALYARRLAGGELGTGIATGTGAGGTGGTLTLLFDKLQASADSSGRLALLAVLRSHWVPLANAARLAAAVAGLRQPAPGQPVANLLLLHTEYAAAGKVAELHRDRHFQPLGQLGTWVAVVAGNETEAVFSEKLRTALQQQLYSDEPGIRLAEMVDDLALGLADGERVFVHLAGVQSLQHLLAVVRQCWPCLFVLTQSAPTCQRLATELGVAAVSPPHPLEVRHMRDINKAEDRASPRAPAPGP